LHENTGLREDEQDLESVVYRRTGHNPASGNVTILPINAASVQVADFSNTFAGANRCETSAL